MATKTPYATSDLGSSIGQTLGNFIDASSLISVPNTTIVGRAQIVDPSKDLKCSFGIERIQTQAIYELQNEFGPAGERVFGVVNDDRGLIRFVGNLVNATDTSGSYIGAPNYAAVDYYVEVTFYGTGLNCLILTAGTPDVRATVDGGAEGSNIFPTNSSVLTSRNYAPNLVIPIVSGLSLGIHTVKIRDAGASGGLFVSGFEILSSPTFTTTGNTTNTSTSVTSLASTSGIVPGLYVSGTGIPAGAYVASVSGTTLTLSAAATATNTGVTLTFLGMNVNQGNAFSAGSKLSVASAYKQGVAPAGFTNTYGTAGTRGGRVLVYLDSNGSIKKDIQYVNTAQANLTSADHTNEEVIRTYHAREFGAGRTDDFSTLSATGANRAFTLDDGTTTLVCSNCMMFNEGVGQYTGAGDYLTFTFVGTGLDINNVRGISSVASYTIIVDGVAILTSTVFGGSGTNNQLKIVSGLPYGTHTVKILATSGGAALYTSKFIVYGPKKPALPSGAVELADYNIMADFVANGTASSVNIATGVLRKLGGREIVYVNGTGGTFDWTIGSVDTTNHIKGYGLVSDRANSYCQYTFFGTGFEYRFYGNNASNVQISLNGTNLTTTNFPTANYSFYGTSVSFNTGTGILNLGGAGAVGGGLAVYYLPLGLYTVKINNGTAGQILSMDTIDIITPIHSPKANLYADLQNTLPVGSQGIQDNRKLQLLPLTTNKAWVQAVGITSGTTTNSGSPVPLPDMSVTIKTSGGPIEIKGLVCLSNSGAASSTTGLRVFVDGIQVGISSNYDNIASGYVEPIPIMPFIVPVSAGTHKIDIYWYTGGGTTATTYSTQRVLTVREI